MIKENYSEHSSDSISINDSLREQAVTDVLKENASLNIKKNPLEFIKKVSEKFMQNQIDAFPIYCQIAQMQNKIKYDELKETSKRGKYTNSIGWSDKGEFKFDYEIPEDLYLFMVNMVYTDFWSNENAKVWRGFMKAVCAGEDSMQLLMKVKTIYGSNSQENMVVN